jgi:RHS repeat-associated protein
VNYQYDGEGQVLAAIRANDEQRFAYDPAGNRVFGAGVFATFDNCNRMVANGAERLSYDVQGNLVLRETPTGTTCYVFNARNLLLAVIRPDSVCVEFEYDACGRRVTKRFGERVTRYMWFGNHLLYEWTEGDAASRIDYQYRPGTHEPLAMRQGGAVYYFHLGHDGAPRRLTDAAGRIVWMADYGVFGDVLRHEGALRQPLRFAGQYADDETGLYYNLARYYAPELGRYISKDPLDFASGPNPYLYCYNDPLGGRDPTGLLSGWAKIAVAAAAIAVGVVVIVVAAPVVIAAVAGAAVTASAIGCAGAVVAGAGLVGMGVGLELAPDGCVACQKKMAIDMGIAFAGAALTGMSMALFPPLAGAGLALAGGGAVGGGSALGLAGIAVGVLGVLGAGIHAITGESEGRTPEEEEAEQKQEEHDAKRKTDAENKATKREARQLDKRSKSGDKDATVQRNKNRAQEERAKGNDSNAEGYEAENKVIDEQGDDVVEAGREVDYPDPNNPGKRITSDIDVETKDQVIQVKSGKEMPSENQTSATRMRAAETGKQPRVIYDPAKMSPEAVQDFQARNPDFVCTPQSLR